MAAAYAQHKTFDQNLSDGGTIVLPGNTVSGNTIIVMLKWSYNGCPPSITDSQGNTYTAKILGTLPGGNDSIWLFTAPVGSSAANTLTLHAGCGQVDSGGVAVEVSGLASNPYDVSNTKSNSTSPADAGSVTPSTDGQYILALFIRGTDMGTTAARSGFTKREQWLGGGNAFEDFVQGTAGAISPDMDIGNISAGYPVRGYTATFKASVVAGGVIKTNDGVVIASKKLIDGLAVASIKTENGVAYQ